MNIYTFLEITSSIDFAAKWEILCLTRDAKQNISHLDAESEISALFVRFALIEDNDNGYNSSIELRRYLVCASSDGQNQGVAILSDRQIELSLDNGEGLDWISQWEIVVEETCGMLSSVGLESLDSEIAED